MSKHQFVREPARVIPFCAPREGSILDSEAYHARKEREAEARAEALRRAQEAVDNARWRNVPVRLFRAWRDIILEVWG